MFRNAACRPALGLFVALLALACAQGADARTSDRNKVMTIEAGETTGTLDDSSPTVLSRGVTIDQGTLHVEAARAVLTSRDGEVARAELTGGPASLEQELDDGTTVSAVADTIDYNLRTEVVVLTGNVFIKQPRNSLRGDRVVYNMRTGQVTSGGEGAGRVRMRILPKNGTSNDADTGTDDGASGAADGDEDAAAGTDAVESPPATDDRSGDDEPADEPQPQDDDQTTDTAAAERG